jgi:hypothetical protein
VIKSKGLLVAVMLSLCTLTSACALSPMQAPASDLFAQMQPLGDASMPMPQALPERPRAALLTLEDVQLMAFDPLGARQLVARDSIGEANTRLAEHCSAGFNELAVSYDTLLDQARDHERYYNRLGERWAQAETDLQRQRFEHGLETWANRALLVLAIGLAL